MVYFILKRMVQSVFVMLAVAFLAFSLFRFVGDPITQMTGVETSVADQERLREELGLKDPSLTIHAVPSTMLFTRARPPSEGSGIDQSG